MNLSIRSVLQRESVRAALILLGLLTLGFFPVVLGNKTLLESAQQASSIMPYGAFTGKAIPSQIARTKDPGAPAWVTEALVQLTKEEYEHEKTLPVWNPYQAMGTPLAANMQSQTYYPLTMALAFWHSPRIWNWYLLSRLFIAGFCAYLYARFFVSFLSALAAGITCMFGGYYLLFISMPHLSVEVLLPAAILCAEYLLRSGRLKSIACFAVMVYLSLTGGMPESSLLLLTLTYVYALFRLVSDPVFRDVYLKRAGTLVLATLFGFGFSAILLVPFRQFMRYSFDAHQFLNTGSVTGLAFDRLTLSAFDYVFPLLYGAGWTNRLMNFAGLIPLFLVIVACVSISWRKGRGDLSALTCFFASLLVVILLKRYGFRPVNALGSLPIFNLVLFTKYEEPLLSLAVSMLCALGLERLTKFDFSPLKQVAALGLTYLFVAAAAFWSSAVIGQELVSDHLSARMTVWSLLLPISLLSALSLVLLYVNSTDSYRSVATSRVRFRLSIFILTILTCEVLGNYLLPIYYKWNTLPSVASNPYEGAPFVRRLQAMAGTNRIFAEDGVLFPDWASTFNLFDIRSLDAMYYRKYLPFVRSFFPTRAITPATDLFDRFTGSGDYRFDDPVQQRLLQVSSVKYVVTGPGNALEHTMVDDILMQDAGHLLPGRENLISKQMIAVGGESRTALGEHPPYERLPYRVSVNGSSETFHFSFGINPAAFVFCGDGVEFIVEVKDEAGVITKLFSRFIDPRHDAALRKWIDGSLDLRPYEGQTIDLLFSTNGGPKGDTCADWAFWSGFHFDDPIPTGPFKLVYGKEVNIYEYQRVLPRAAIYYNADVRPDENEVRKSLASPSLNVFRTVLLNGAALNSDEAAWVRNMDSSPGGQVEEGKIIAYSSRSVTTQATLKSRGILVLNDSDFPGWAVTVDGKPAKIISANYMFRGVLLEPGQHLVRFDYAPKSMALGEGISMASLLSFGIFSFFTIRRRSRLAIKSGEKVEV